MTSPRRIVPPEDQCICGKPFTECDIPFGYCHCRCGEKTAIAAQSETRCKAYFGFPKMYAYRHSGQVRPNLDNDPPFDIDGVMCRFLPLTNGRLTIIDASDYDFLNQWNWHARKTSNGHYAVRGINLGGGKFEVVWMHRLIKSPVPEGETVDHESTNTLDNRRKNLRYADHFGQTRNQRVRRDTSSGYKGVSLNNRQPGWWFVTIRVNGRQTLVGKTRDAIKAALMYDEAARKHFGEFARLNFPRSGEQPARVETDNEIAQVGPTSE